MFVQIEGQCLFASEPKSTKGGPQGIKTYREFHFLVQVPKQAPELVKAVSFNGFNPKLGETTKFNARVSAREYKGRALLNCEVL